MDITGSVGKGKTNGKKHVVSVGHYDEKLFFIDSPAVITDADQKIIQKLQEGNQGVGIIAGLLDERLTIRMISSLAEKMLGYDEKLFEECDNPCLSNFFVTGDDDAFVRDKLTNPTGELWSYCAKCNGDVIISVRIANLIAESSNGETMWYMAIRRLGEYRFDTLTGGYTRRGFIRYINKQKENGADLKNYAILFTDIKGFKAINEMYGSQAGDNVLMTVYNHLVASSLKPEICARKESDKFLLFVKKENLNLDNLPNVMKVSCLLGGKQRVIESVCGIYYIHNEDVEVSAMIDCAKLAKKYIEDVYVSSYAIFDAKMEAEYVSYASALLRFEEALEQGEFVVYYQPIVDCKTEKVVSAEALVRWNTKNGGLISPAVFIPALEEMGNIIKLDRYVYRQAADLLYKRAKLKKPNVSISVNFSRMDFFDKDCINLLYERLKKDVLAREFIHIEITETAHRSISTAQAEFINKVNGYGGMVYIDDFGVANSSMDFLTKYDFAVVKLDMQFIREMMTNIKIRTLVESVIAMAHRMNMKVVAEGVESKIQLEVLRQFGCDFIQGYYFSKPLAVNDFEDYISTHI